MGGREDFARTRVRRIYTLAGFLKPDVFYTYVPTTSATAIGCNSVEGFSSQRIAGSGSQPILQYEGFYAGFGVMKTRSPVSLL